MVKKINGKKPSTSGGTGAVERSQSIKAGKVNTTDRVGAASKQKESQRIRHSTRQMSAAEREHLFRLVSEEADKLVEANVIPKSKRKTIESAIQMTINASITEKLDEEQK